MQEGRLMDADKTARPRVSDALQGSAHEDPEMDGALLLGFVAVAEWAAPGGERWLSIVDGSTTGDDLATWTRQGYLHNALYHGDTFSREDNSDADHD
jgi:hypothetical protein